MPVYRYTARDERGRKVSGTLEADSERVLRSLLREKNLLVTSRARELRKIKWIDKKKVSIEELVIFCEQLGTMLNAGLPIVQSLRAIEAQAENKRFKEVINGIKQGIAAGDSLSDSLARYPRIFSVFFISLVRAGETGGILDKALNRLGVSLTHERDLREKIRGALTYPTAVLTLLLIVVTFLLVAIIPIFASTYQRLRVSLPLPTVILINLSRFIIHYWWAILGTMVVFIFLFRGFRQSNKGRLAIDRFKLEMPIFGRLVSKVSVSRYIQTLAALLASGIPITEALPVAKQTAGNEVIKKIIEEVRVSVRGGGNIAEPLEKSKFFPPMVVQMTAVGEESGTLPEMLKKSAQFLDRDVNNTIKRLTVRLEPLLTISLAFVVGFIALAVYLPMFDLIRQLTR